MVFIVVVATTDHGIVSLRINNQISKAMDLCTSPLNPSADVVQFYCTASELGNMSVEADAVCSGDNKLSGKIEVQVTPAGKSCVHKYLNYLLAIS